MQVLLQNDKMERYMKTYYIAKILHKMRISSFKNCSIDKTSKVDSECTLSKVKMGRYSYVGSGSRITDTNIGSFCSIGGRCGIGGGIHPTYMVSTSPVFLQGRNILKKNFANIQYEPSKTVNIGNDVWIGEGVCIISGVSVGDGAVIGAHAVVTHDVEPYSIVAGIPAKVIRKRFDEDTINNLLDIKWWDLNDNDLNSICKYFEDPERLISILRK